MKILVLGAGAIGGYYGAELRTAGNDVTFLVRERRQAQLQSAGLVLRIGDQSASTPVKSITEVTSSDSYDLVLLSCKTYDLGSAMKAIAPALNSGAFVLPLLNGLSAYSALDECFGKDKVLGGVAYVAVTMNEHGVISRAGDTDRLIFGARSPEQREVVERLLKSFSGTERMRSASDSIEQDLWNKWVMLAAGAAVTCSMRGAVQDIMQAAGGRALMKSAIEQCSGVARAAGHEIADATRRQIDGMLLNESSPWAASMMRDMAAGAKKLETDAIVGDMVRRGDESGLDVGVLAYALCHLQVYELRARGV